MIIDITWTPCPRIMKIGTQGKNYADSKFDSHIAFWAIPDYEPLKRNAALKSRVKP